jgi:hypothetical protein
LCWDDDRDEQLLTENDEIFIKKRNFGIVLCKTNLEISALISFATLLAKEISNVWKPEFIEEFIMSPISDVSWNRSKKRHNF